MSDFETFPNGRKQSPIQKDFDLLLSDLSIVSGESFQESISSREYPKIVSALVRLKYVKALPHILSLLMSSFETRPDDRSSPSNMDTTSLFHYMLDVRMLRRDIVRLLNESSSKDSTLRHELIRVSRALDGMFYTHKNLLRASSFFGVKDNFDAKKKQQVLELVSFAYDLGQHKGPEYIQDSVSLLFSHIDLQIYKDSDRDFYETYITRLVETSLSLLLSHEHQYSLHHFFTVLLEQCKKGETYDTNLLLVSARAVAHVLSNRALLPGERTGALDACITELEKRLFPAIEQGERVSRAYQNDNTPLLSETNRTALKKFYEELLISLDFKYGDLLIYAGISRSIVFANKIIDDELPHVHKKPEPSIYKGLCAMTALHSSLSSYNFVTRFLALRSWCQPYIEKALHKTEDLSLSDIERLGHIAGRLRESIALFPQDAGDELRIQKESDYMYLLKTIIDALEHIRKQHAIIPIDTRLLETALLNANNYIAFCGTGGESALFSSTDTLLFLLSTAHAQNNGPLLQYGMQLYRDNFRHFVEQGKRNGTPVASDAVEIISTHIFEERRS